MADHISEFVSLDDLKASGAIERYRKIKHGLGAMFVEPSVAQAILRTNLEMGRKVQQLYDVEEDAIAAGFSRLEQIEETAGFSEFMSLELESLRLDIERMETGREQDDVRIDAVRRLRDQADSVLSRLAELDAESEPVDPMARSGEVIPTVEAEGMDIPTREALATDLLERLLGQLEALLIATDTLEEADMVLQDPGLPLDLERREIEAYLLLRDGSSPEPELDRRLLTAASLRVRLSILHDHLAAGSSGLSELEAVAALNLAEELLEWFRQLVFELDGGGPTSASAEMRFLKVRLMADYAALWLEVNGSPEQSAV